VSQPAPDHANDQLVELRVHIRASVLQQIRAAAGREGASAESLAALWLEEHAEELRRATGG
jgi:hypothetical protein